MKISSILLTIAKIAFLIQYYILIMFLILKNIYYKIINPKYKGHSVFAHPK